MRIEDYALIGDLHNVTAVFSGWFIAVRETWTGGDGIVAVVTRPQ